MSGLSARTPQSEGISRVDKAFSSLISIRHMKSTEGVRRFCADEMSAMENVFLRPTGTDQGLAFIVAANSAKVVQIDILWS